MSAAPYSRLCVKSGFHRKILHVGNAAWGARCRLVAISNDYKTDGWVDETTVRMVCTEAELEALVTPFPWSEHNAPLLRREGSGYVIHDFLDWNDSATERNKKEEKKDEARANERKRVDSWRKKKRETDTRTDTVTEPVQEPLHTRTSTHTRGVGVGVVSEYGSESDAGARDPAPDTPPEPPPPPTPSPPVAGASGAMGFAATAWCEGAKSVTGGRPTLAWWERRDIETLALDRPPDAEPSGWGHAEGVAFAKRQRACKPSPQVTAKNYLLWVGDGRPGPFERGVGLAKPDPAPAPYHATGDARDWLREAPPTGEEVAAGAAAALAALGGAR